MTRPIAIWTWRCFLHPPSRFEGRTCGMASFLAGFSKHRRCLVGLNLGGFSISGDRADTPASGSGPFAELSLLPCITHSWLCALAERYSWRLKLATTWRLNREVYGDKRYRSKYISFMDFLSDLSLLLNYWVYHRLFSVLIESIFLKLFFLVLTVCHSCGSLEEKLLPLVQEISVDELNKTTFAGPPSLGGS